MWCLFATAIRRLRMANRIMRAGGRIGPANAAYDPWTRRCLQSRVTVIGRIEPLNQFPDQEPLPIHARFELTEIRRGRRSDSNSSGIDLRFERKISRDSSGDQIGVASISELDRAEWGCRERDPTPTDRTPPRPDRLEQKRDTTDSPKGGSRCSTQVYRPRRVFFRPDLSRTNSLTTFPTDQVQHSRAHQHTERLLNGRHQRQKGRSRVFRGHELGAADRAGLLMS